MTSLFAKRAHHAGRKSDATQRDSSGTDAAPANGAWIRRQTTERSPGLLIHYHIFKNAGTSFEWALQSAFGDRYTSFDTTQPRGFISRRELKKFIKQHPSLCAISSHQCALPPPRIRRRNVLTSILIRDPIERIRSIYRFERIQLTSSPGAIKAKQLGFKEYVEWRLEETPTAICNYQVYFCVRRRRLKRPMGAKDLQRAIARLKEMPIVGTVTRYEEWLRLAQQVLSCHFGGIILSSVRHNVTSEPVKLVEAHNYQDLGLEIGERTAKRLLEQNQLDVQLCQAANALLTLKLNQSVMVRTSAYLSLRDSSAI